MLYILSPPLTLTVTLFYAVVQSFMEYTHLQDSRRRSMNGPRVKSCVLFVCREV